MRRKVKVTKGRARRCPSGKARYRDHGSAMVVLRNIQGRGGDLTRAYQCPTCLGWHLTSQRAAS